MNLIFCTKFLYTYTNDIHAIHQYHDEDIYTIIFLFLVLTNLNTGWSKLEISINPFKYTLPTACIRNIHIVNNRII